MKQSNKKRTEEIEKMLSNANVSFSARGDNYWMIASDEGSLAVSYKPHVDILEFIVPFMQIPTKEVAEFYNRLLDLNFDDLDYGAFAIAEAEVVLVERIHAASLDVLEVRAIIQSLFDALHKYLDDLKLWDETH